MKNYHSSFLHLHHPFHMYRVLAQRKPFCEISSLRAPDGTLKIPVARKKKKNEKKPLIDHPLTIRFTDWKFPWKNMKQCCKIFCNLWRGIDWTGGSKSMHDGLTINCLHSHLSLILEVKGFHGILNSLLPQGRPNYHRGQNKNTNDADTLCFRIFQHPC